MRERAAEAIDAFLRALGHDPERDPQLRGTGARVAELFADELIEGHGANLDAIYAEAMPAKGGQPIERTSEARSATALDRTRVARLSPESRGGESHSIVVVQGIATHVVCPHHLTIAAGHADVAYLPRDRVLGLGEVARLVDALAHRLALQEDVTQSIAHAFVDGIDARGAACAMRLRHPCLAHHGPKKRGASVTTIAFAGSCDEGDDRALALAALSMEGLRTPRSVVGAAKNAKRAKKAKK